MKNTRKMKNQQVEHFTKDKKYICPYLSNGGRAVEFYKTGFCLRNDCADCVAELNKKNKEILAIKKAKKLTAKKLALIDGFLFHNIQGLKDLLKNDKFRIFIPGSPSNENLNKMWAYVCVRDYFNENPLLFLDSFEVPIDEEYPKRLKDNIHIVTRGAFELVNEFYGKI